MNKYSIIEVPNKGYAVITPMQERGYSTSRLVMPTWLPANHTHMGIFPTMEKAIMRMDSLKKEAI